MSSNINVQPPDGKDSHGLGMPSRSIDKNGRTPEEPQSRMEEVEVIEQELSGGAAPKQCECSCKIRNIAIQCWESSGYTELKKLDCDFESGVVYLRGIVSSFYYKQLAQETIRHIEGINRIINEIVVRKPK
ncbi:BON domain-containing protein [Rhodopirellula sp. JC639]|uniref:BON domain-containing protein n=1 Tax=Stieleria mannarensis TaxID=2755585 RepID=UPI001604772F